ncbi:MAG TPA: stage II sporulation protein P [Symbiobacteriaceae bacterium]|nr:stage II sporulation protein P [Symbiobacteriaceae bacterium]
MSRAWDEADEHGTTHVVQQDGVTVFRTGLTVHQGDRFIDSLNDVWRIVKVEGRRAVALRVAKLTDRPAPQELARLRRGLPRAARALTGDRPVDVGLYHSHSDESYIPSDGVESAPDKGSIYQVGARFGAALAEHGLSVIHRPDNHNPHDHGAYLRSRRTAVELIETAEPAALFDIHRDAAPAEEYRMPQGASRVMIVIGRSNPAYEANLTFARLLKAEADTLSPGLVKGIFLGRGNYNQDLMPRNLILEVGSQNVRRQDAEAGAAILAGAVPRVLQTLEMPDSPARQTESIAASRSIAWLILAVVLIGSAWMLLVHGGWRPALAHLRRLRRR